MLERPYDLILTLGDDCACSWYLRAFGLQNASTLLTGSDGRRLTALLI
jgi:hypothetical protein